MATFGMESLPMLEEYFFKALSDGDTVKAEIIRQQILDIKGEAEPTRTDLDSGVFVGTEDDPLYPFF
jgi:hypothetical protein